ncbi:hypothetical protein [Absidia glauca]|uniref:Centromere protein H C-terminal domain-containing protein n=1 Tax=Absidia glauca TaxID=4829 RepID=A0A163ITT7_ABSGL|nr:hypothetical protein [Absidia glauca]
MNPSLSSLPLSIYVADMETSPPLLSKKEQHILDSQMEIEWLQRQIEQRKQGFDSFAANKENVAQLTDKQVLDELAIYSEKVEHTRVDMDIMSQYNLCKDRIVTNVDDNHYTLNALYPHLKPQSYGFDSEKIQQIQSLVMQRDKLAVEEMQLLEELDNIENQTMRLHTQIIEHHQDNQQLGADLATAKEQQQQEQRQEPASQWRNTETASVVSSQATGDFNVDKLRDIQNRLETSKNILMGLILESGIDWASDSKWSRVMLFIGTEEDD